VCVLALMYMRHTDIRTHAYKLVDAHKRAHKRAHKHAHKCTQAEDEEEESDGLVNQVLDEIGIANLTEVATN